MNTSTLPSDLMTNSLLHFQNGVPIADLALRNDQKRRLARVSHVYWQWMQNPYTVDYKALLRQMVKGHFADAPAETRAAQRDILLFEFIKESVSPISRREAEVKAKVAIDKMLRIGMETDNVTALDKGTKHIITLAGLDKPEDHNQDMSKVMFLPPVVTTNVTDVDPSRENITDEQAMAIIKKYNAYVDPKRQAVDERVDTMLAQRNAPDGEETEREYEDE